MASVITATTTSGLTQSADNSGVLQLASGTGNLVTIPSVTGTAMVSGNMPAFSAYMSAGQALSSTTSTLLAFNTKTFDTATCFNNTGGTVTLNGISVPAYSFAPNVAGYYQVSANFGGAAPSAPGDISIAIRKNNSEILSSGSYIGTSSYTVRMAVSGLTYLNGTSDYLNVYAYVGSGQTTQSGSQVTSFSAVLVRSA